MAGLNLPGLVQPPSLPGDEEEELDVSSYPDLPSLGEDVEDVESVDSDVDYGIEGGDDFSLYPTSSDVDQTETDWQEMLDELTALREEQDAEDAIFGEEEDDALIQQELEQELADIEAEGMDTEDDSDVELDPSLTPPTASDIEGSAATGATAPKLDVDLPANPTRSDLVRYARSAASKAGIDPDLFEKQINQESGFQLGLTSSAGARGIAQIVPRYHPDANPDDPKAALDYAAQLMARHQKNYGGDIRKALMAYNGGGGAVQAFDSGELNSYGQGETKKYLDIVLGAGWENTGGGGRVRALSAALPTTDSSPAEEPPPPPSSIVEQLDQAAQDLFGKPYLELDPEQQRIVFKAVLSGQPAQPAAPVPATVEGEGETAPPDIEMGGEGAPDGTPAIPPARPAASRRNPPGFWKNKLPMPKDPQDQKEWMEDNAPAPPRPSATAILDQVGMHIWGKSYGVQNGAERAVTIKVTAALDGAAKASHGKQFRDLSEEDRAALLLLVGNSIPIPEPDPMDDPKTKAQIERDRKGIRDAGKAVIADYRRRESVARAAANRAALWDRQDRRSQESIARANANRSASWARADRIRQEGIIRAAENRAAAWDRADQQRAESWSRADMIREANQARQDRLRSENWGRQDRLRMMKALIKQPTALTATLGSSSSRSGGSGSGGAIPSWATLSLILSPDDRAALISAWEGGSLGQSALSHPRLLRAMAAFPFSGSAPEWLAVAQALWMQGRGGGNSSSNGNAGASRAPSRTSLPQVRQRVIRRR